MPIIDCKSVIRESVLSADPNITEKKLINKIDQIHKDFYLLIRCVHSQTFITYSDIAILRGTGHAINVGNWLDNVYLHVIAPLGLPNFTMIVVSKGSKLPSHDLIKNNYTRLSKIHIDDIEIEQQICFQFDQVHEFFDTIEKIPDTFNKLPIPQITVTKETEINRCVHNAIARTKSAGRTRTLVGRNYPDSVTKSELMIATDELWNAQKGLCALTRQPFATQNTDANELIQDNQVSIDRIDNSKGYFKENIQLVTQFANRARGTLSIEDARKRLVQHSI